MDEFDGRKVLAGALGILLSAGLMAVAGPIGFPLFMTALIYTMIVASAKQACCPIALSEPSMVEPARGVFVESVSCTREIVVQTASGDRLGFRQQEVHSRYR